MFDTAVNALAIKGRLIVIGAMSQVCVFHSCASCSNLPAPRTPPVESSPGLHYPHTRYATTCLPACLALRAVREWLAAQRGDWPAREAAVEVRHCLRLLPQPLHCSMEAPPGQTHRDLGGRQAAGEWQGIDLLIANSRCGG